MFLGEGFIPGQLFYIRNSVVVLRYNDFSTYWLMYIIQYNEVLGYKNNNSPKDITSYDCSLSNSLNRFK